MTTETIRLADLITDIRVREAIDYGLVEQYADAMRAGDKFPPVSVFRDGERLFLADGQHRREAAERCGLAELLANVHTGTASDAIWFALGANARHGARLGRGDMRRAVLLAVEQFPDRTQTEIARHVGCSREWVNRCVNCAHREDVKPYLPPAGCGLWLIECDGREQAWVTPHTDPKYLFVTAFELDTAGGENGGSFVGNRRAVLAERAIRQWILPRVEKWAGMERIVLRPGDADAIWGTAGPWERNRLLYPTHRHAVGVRA